MFARDVAASYDAPPDLVERGLFRVRTGILIGFAKTLAGEHNWPLELVRRQVDRAFAEAAIPSRRRE